MTDYIVYLNRWGPDEIENQVFPSRKDAVAAAQALVDQFANQSGGWHSCPPSHADGCKWHKITRVERELFGWGSDTVTDMWGHRRSGDKAHTERITVMPVGTERISA